MTPLKEDDNSPLDYKSKRAQSTSVSSTKGQKRGSAQENTTITTAEGMNSLASSVIAPQLTALINI